MRIAAGTRFGRLEVLAYCSPQTDPKHPKYRCRCDCGREKNISGDNMSNGRSLSCGCLRTEKTRARSITHGLSKSREYKSWADMVARCTRESATAYPKYGAVGIFVDPEWIESFSAFYADMGPMPSPKHTIDRTNNALGYSRANCRWSTRKTQRINQRRTKIYTFQGVTGTLKDLARVVGLSYTAVHQRVNTLGWTVDRALTEPLHH